MAAEKKEIMNIVHKQQATIIELLLVSHVLLMLVLGRWRNMKLEVGMGKI
jgi:hypothetical protein